MSAPSQTEIEAAAKLFTRHPAWKALRTLDPYGEHFAAACQMLSAAAEFERELERTLPSGGPR